MSVRTYQGHNVGILGGLGPLYSRKSTPRPQAPPDVHRSLLQERLQAAIGAAPHPNDITFPAGDHFAALSHSLGTPCDRARMNPGRRLYCSYRTQQDTTRRCVK